MQHLEEKIVKTLLGQEASIQFQQGDIAKRFLQKHADNIRLMSESYVTNEKSAILSNMSEPELVEAYALYYLPINFYKLVTLFEEISELFKQHFRMLDYGAGPATATLAAATFSENFEADIVDKSQEMLKMADRLLKGSKVNYSLLLADNFELKEKYNLIVAANSLNEFTPAEEGKFLKDIYKLLADNGYLLIVEPALQVTARHLMEFRKKFLANYAYDIIYPCTHCLECKMLLDGDEWCHAALEGLDSRLVKQLDDITGYNKHRIKYSAIIFKKSQQSAQQNRYRIVSIPKKDKRGISMKLCGSDFYGERLFQKNAVSADGEKVKKLKLADLLKL